MADGSHLFSSSAMEARTPDPHRYDQLCQSLLCLDEAVDKIFNIISNRVVLQYQHLNALQRRIRSAQAKVNALSRTKKAITIFSSSKYPVNLQDREDFVSLFGRKMEGISTEFPVAKISLSTGLYQVGGEGTLELYHFFTETSSELQPNLKARANIPAKAASESMLSNSLEHPYFKLKSTDKVEEAEKLSIETSSKKPIIFHNPPQSVLTAADEVHLGSNDFGFRPVLHQVPALSLPAVLPSLAMVAETSWNGLGLGSNKLSSIAPSAVRSGSQKYLADSISSRSPSLASPKESIIASTKTAQVSLPPPPPPPPPLPPTVQRVTANDASNSSNEVTTLSSITAGQPDTSDARSYKNSSGIEESRPQPLPLIDPQREALLESIRNHDFCLRKTGFADYGKKPDQSISRAEQNASSSKLRQHANLLEEMATSLKMRRLSMQGAVHDKVFLKPGLGTSEAGSSASPSSSSGKFVLPIANLHDYIAKKNEEISDDDEWDE